MLSNRQSSAFTSDLAAAAALVLVLLAGPAAGQATAPTAQAPAAPPVDRPSLIPWPTSVTLSQGEPFEITKDTVIEVTPGHADLKRLAGWVADLVKPALETRLTVRDSASPTPRTIRLEVDPKSAIASEGYELTISADGVRITGKTAAGVFYGVQTLRQLLPWKIELRGIRPFKVSVPQARITDAPRFTWRGAMLDVARHYFSPPEVKRYIDLLALYKINRLHLHLTDDQGWRIQIAKWPKLTTLGATTEVKGGPGGFYTKKDYAGIVSYARDRFMTIVPEIDMPSHCNAALSAYPQLNCDGKATKPYTGIEVGFSNFCFTKPITFKFLDDVIKELAAMTPGPWIHVGGDEVKKMTPPQYASFMERAQRLVVKHGKVPVGWDEILHSKLEPSAVIQYWRPRATTAPPAGTKVILSPANKFYLDMKYDAATILGLDWAGKVDVDVPYGWDPAKYLTVDESQILGVEAPIWSETTDNMDDVEFLMFPRLPAAAEVGWTAQAARDWSEFRVRLGAQAPRWSALGINAFWSPKIDWKR
jgi:hexosaminidase